MLLLGRGLMRVLKKKGCYENYLTRRRGEFFMRLPMRQRNKDVTPVTLLLHHGVTDFGLVKG